MIQETDRTVPTRKRRTRTKTSNTEGSSGQSTSDLQLVEPMKRQAAVRRKIKNLAALPSLPLDILFEIFSNLRPHDLLKLARTTKDFRRFLMARSSISVWKAARQSIPGLPDCPPDMSEPAWANLAFSQHCHYCLTSHVRTVEWVFRVRMCAKCAKSRLGEQFCSIFDWNWDNPRVPRPDFFTMIPTRPGKRNKTVYLVDELTAVRSHHDSLETVQEKRQYITDRVEYVKGIVAHADLCKKWANGQTKDRNQELQNLRDERKEAIIAKLVALGFEQDIASIRYPDSLTDHRLVKQPQRLTERVWANIREPLVEYMGEVRQRRLARELAQLIIRRKEFAMKVLRDYKNALLPVTDLLPEGPDFCNFPPIKEVLEQPADVTVDGSSFADIIPLIPELIKTWRDEKHEQLLAVVKRGPVQRRPPLTDFVDVLEFLEEIETRERFIPAIPTMTNEVAEKKMKLAATIFSCKDCRSSIFYGMDYDDDSDGFDFGIPSQANPLFYPQVLGHKCLTCQTAWMPSFGWDGSEFDYSKSFSHALKERKAWDCSGLSLDTTTSNIARKIITEAGKDPKTTTSKQMDACGLSFVCGYCIKPAGDDDDDNDDNDEDEDEDEEFYRGDPEDDIRSERSDDSMEDACFTRLYGWREMIKHHASDHPSKEIAIRILTEKDTENYLLIHQLPRDDYFPHTDNKVWSCIRCRDSPKEMEATNMTAIEAHMKALHDVNIPEINVDYFRVFSALGSNQPPLVKCSLTSLLSSPE